MGAEDQLTLGQLVRQKYGAACRCIGFSTYAGSVTAAEEWGGPAKREGVRPALGSSMEELMHDTGMTEFVLRMDLPGDAIDILRQPRLQRAIGVIYHPGTERQSHYYHARPADQFDALIHLDVTTAITPLEPTRQWIDGTIPETYPSGL